MTTPKRWLTTCIAWAAVAWLAVAALTASEHRGVVRSGGLPVPGATVTATQGDKRIVTTTGDQGEYTFRDLPEGDWSIEVDMLGFAKSALRISGDSGEAAQWELRMLSASETAALAAPKPAFAPVSAESSPAAQQGQQKTANVQTAANQQAGAPSQRGSSARQAATAQNQASAGRGGRAQIAGGGNSNEQDFQQLSVNQSSDISLFGHEGVISSDMAAELSPSANTAFVVQGSMTGALGMQAQNDWGPFGGRGMEPGMGMMGFGGPGGVPGIAGLAPAADGTPNPAGDSTQIARPEGPRGAGAAVGGGRGGPGGGRGGMMGGRPPGGGEMGGGQPLGGGRGGRGGAGPEWMGRPNALAFGNARRNPALTYNGNLSIMERNSVLNAQSYSLTGQNIEKPYSNNTNVAASLGGPLMIPKLMERSKGQFTLNVSVSRNRNGQTTQLTTMPSALERIGDFSQSAGANGEAVTIYDPATNAPFPGNKIPVSRLDPVALSLLKYYPSPNLPGVTRNYQSALTSFSNNNTFNLRVSPRISLNDNIVGGISYQGSNNTSPNLFGFTDAGSGRAMNANLSFRHTFTNRRIATVNFTFSRNRNLLSPYFAYREDVASALGIQGVSTDPLNWGPPTLTFTNFAGLSDGAASLIRNQTASIAPSLRWVYKSHTLIMGGEFRRQQNNRNASLNARGTFTFNGYGTSLIQAGAAMPGTGFDLADFLLGAPDTATIRYANSSLYFRGSTYAAYFTDDWRINARFSMNTGLRWDYQAPWTEKNNQLVNLDIAPNFTAVARVQPGQTGGTTGRRYAAALVNPDRNNVSPRFGFAWRPIANKSTVVRGGYGLYYNPSAYSSIAANMSQQPPLAEAWNLNIQNTALTLSDAFVDPASKGINTLTSNTYAIDPNYRIGYAQSWTLSVQQGLPRSLMTSISYTGTKGSQLDRRFQPWVLPPGSTGAVYYPSGYTYQTYGGNSIYHGLTMGLIRRFSAGLMANASYTWSKAIDDLSEAQNWLDLRAERALSSSDRRHALNVNFQYSTGQGRSGGGMVTGWKGHLLRDWSLASNITVSSGSPLTVTAGGNQLSRNTANFTSLRADATGISISPVLAGQHFNPAAFAIPAAGTWGTAGRNVVPGPMIFSLNASAGRGFRIGERRRMDLRLNANNVLNTVVVTRWNTVLGSNTFGQPTNVNAMRNVSATLRFNF